MHAQLSSGAGRGGRRGRAAGSSQRCSLRAEVHQRAEGSQEVCPSGRDGGACERRHRDGTPGSGAGAVALAGEPGATRQCHLLAAELSALEETGGKIQSSQNKEEGDTACLPGPGMTPNLENAVLREVATREGQRSPDPTRARFRERAGSQRQEGEWRSPGVGAGAWDGTPLSLFGMIKRFWRSRWLHETVKALNANELYTLNGYNGTFRATYILPKPIERARLGTRKERLRG